MSENRDVMCVFGRLPADTGPFRDLMLVHNDWGKMKFFDPSRARTIIGLNTFGNDPIAPGKTAVIEWKEHKGPVVPRFMYAGAFAAPKGKTMDEKAPRCIALLRRGKAEQSWEVDPVDPYPNPTTLRAPHVWIGRKLTLWNPGTDPIHAFVTIWCDHG